MKFAIHPERLATCFAGAGASGVVTAMAASERFAPRLQELGMRHYRLFDWNIADPVDRRLAALDRDELEAFAVPCGAVVWSSAILREIRGNVVATMIDRFGSNAMALARMLSELALDRTMPEGIDAFDAALHADGRGCIAAWIAAQPAPVQAHLRLKWPSDALVPDTQDLDVLAEGAAILRRVAVAEFQA